MKASHIPTVLQLISDGAKDHPVPMTTTALAKKLGKSQQLASKHLDEMEKEGLVEKIRSGGKTYVKLTKKGTASAAEIYSKLHSVFGALQHQIEVSGTIFSGLGEGAYYIGIKGYRKQFISKLGFDPFPGTLNIRLNTAVDRKVRRDLAVAKGKPIEGFENGKRTYGGAQCFSAIIDSKLEGAVLVIERTSYDDSVMEVISPFNIRRQLHLKDGDPIRLRIFLENSGTGN